MWDTFFLHVNLYVVVPSVFSYFIPQARQRAYIFLFIFSSSKSCQLRMRFIFLLSLFQSASSGRRHCAEDMWLWNSMRHSDPHDQQQRKCSMDGSRGIWRQVWVTSQVFETLQVPVPVSFVVTEKPVYVLLLFGLQTFLCSHLNQNISPASYVVFVTSSFALSPFTLIAA